MPSIQTTNISTVVAQTAHPSTNQAVRAASTTTSPTQLALISQQAAAIAKVAVKDDAVRVTKNPKRVEGVFAIDKDKPENSPDAENQENSGESPQGKSEGPIKKKLSLRV